MADNDVFSLLTGGGVKFDKRRFSKDFESFRVKAPATPFLHTGAAGPGPSSAATTAASIQGIKKKGGKAKGPGLEHNAGISFFNGAAAEHDDGEGLEEEPSGAAARRRATDKEQVDPLGHVDGDDRAEEGDDGGSSDADGNDVSEHADQDAELDPGCPNVSSRDIHEADNAVRKHYRIKVAGYDPAPPLRSFQQLVTKLNAPSGLLRNLRQGGYEQPTPIQRQAIPILMSGRELLAVAPTGSGKTLAFMLPVLAKLRQMRSAGDWPAAVKAVLLSPTNELAMQQARCLKLLLPGSGLKGSLLTKSTAAGTDWAKVDILLANPLRLLSLADSKKIDLSQARFLVLDEADKLFELGFMEQVDGIIAACSHKDVVRALFSATLPEKVEELARSVLQQPLRVTVGVRNSAATTVKQRLLFAGKEAGKLVALRQLLREGLKPPVLVFVASKERAKALHRELMYDGVHVDSVHSEQSHAARNAAVDNFRLGKTWLLIATDLIGRGMDFIGVRTVINYDFPNSTADYIHRIGRTGRAGHEGEAVTFFTEEDSGLLRGVANLIKEAGGEVPDYMLHMKKDRNAKEKRRRLPPSVVSGDTISTRPKMDKQQQKRKQEMIAASKKRARLEAAKQ